MSWCWSVRVHLVTLCTSCIWIFVFFRFGKFSARFLQIYFQSPFIFLILLKSLLYVNWHALYYPIGLSYIAFIFSFGFLSAVLIGAHVCSWWSPIAWEHVHGERSFYDSTTSFLVCPLTMALCLSGVPNVLSHISSVAILQPLQAVSAQPVMVLFPGLTPKSWASASSPHLYWQTSISAWRVQGSGANCLCRSLSVFPSSHWFLCSPPRLQSSPFIQADVCASKGTSQGGGIFPPSQLPHGGRGPILIPVSLFSCPTSLCGSFLALSEVWGLLPTFSRCSVWIILLLCHLDPSLISLLIFHYLLLFNR